MTLLEFIEEYCQATYGGSLSFNTFLVKFSEHLTMEERTQHSVDDIKTSLPLPFYVFYDEVTQTECIANMEWK